MDLTARTPPANIEAEQACPVDPEQCLFTKTEALGWLYLLMREPDKAHRKHVLRIAIQHGLIMESLATALSWTLRLEQE